MELEPLNEIIKKALDYFDMKTYKYNYLISNQNIKVNTIDNLITFKLEEDNIKYNYELLGYYDNMTGIWIWGWVLSYLNHKDISLCKFLLEYGLKLEPETTTQEHLMIKGILVNSRIKIDEIVQLDINLAIYSYIVRDNFKFIYPRRKYLDDSKKSYITFYLLIK